MKKIVFNLMVVFLFWSCNSSKKTVVHLNQKTHFPKSWQGNYKGEINIYTVDSIAMKLPMELFIKQKSDSLFRWQITYDFKGKKDIRNYDLILVNKEKGKYIIDEKNSIKIDAFYKNEIFTSFFNVMQNFIIVSYTKQNNTIVFEIISADAKKPKITGNTTVENEKIPEVKSYKVTGRQKAILIKQNNYE